tara:strand:- start:1078 stop:1275 length:198 start_codon:yes stop_codon:yes gene_type:complete
MKVGDLIKYESAMNDSMDRYSIAYGIIVQLSRTGHKTLSAQVLFNDGELAWFDSHVLEVVSAAGR